jgi:hypothetical protein
MTFYKIIQELRNKYGIVKKWDDQQKISLKINSSYEIFLEHSPFENVFFLSTPIFQLTQTLSKEFYKKLLSFNLFGNQTGSAFLCIDETANVVMLMERFEEKDIDFIQFEDKLKQFLSLIASLKETIFHLEFSSTKSSSSVEEFTKLTQLKKI